MVKIEKLKRMVDPRSSCEIPIARSVAEGWGLRAAQALPADVRRQQGISGTAERLPENGLTEHIIWSMLQVSNLMFML